MEESAWIVETLAGGFFILAGIPLLRLAARRGEFPERMLGLTFVLMGVSYGFYMGPIIFSGLEPLWTPFNFTGRVLYDVSAVAVALFTREVFRKNEPWATWVVRATIALLVSGIAVSGLYGDWEGLSPISNPGFWLEWAGQSTPFVWVGVEGIQNYRNAKKRVRFGLTDAMVCNRFLLWSLFGAMQLATLVVLVIMNVEYEIHGHFSVTTDALEGTFEMLTIAVIWLAFFPPRLYRGWISAAAAAGRVQAS